MKKNCPKLKDSNGNDNANISEEAEMVLVSEETRNSPFSTTMWFGDTNVMGHMMNMEEGLTDVVMCSSSVTVRNGKAVKVTKMGTLHGTVMQKDGMMQAIVLE